MDNNQKKTEFVTGLTDEELDKVVTEAEKSTENLEIDIRKIKNEVEVNPDAELKSENVLESIGGDSDRMVMPTAIPTSDISLFDIDSDEEYKPEPVELTPESIRNSRESMNLTDDEVYALLDAINKYKTDPNGSVYNSLPERFKSVVKQIAMNNGLEANSYNKITKIVLDEFISDANVEQAFIDLQKSLDEALNIPSIVDEYSSHMRDVMENKIPDMAEKIKEESPEKAELLLKVKDSFTKAYDYSFAKQKYEELTQVRKSIRRCSDRELKLAIRNFNYRNSSSKFIMNDANELPIVLTHILHTEPQNIFKISNEKEIPERYRKIIDMNITPEDITKFTILVCNTCINMNPNDVIDASYMYYMLKNIITLKHTNEAKTDFAVELINNICDTISFIRNKEAEFNAEHLDESKSRKKSSKKCNIRK